MDLPFYDDHFGKNPILKCRGSIGTSILNVYALVQLVNWSKIFDIGYKLDITSSSTADTAAGTGLQTLIVYGLDDDYNPLTEVVTMNGQTIVQTANEFRRVFAAYMLTTGTGNQNAGDIYFMKTGTGGTYTAGVPGTLSSGAAKMLAGDNLAYSGVWTAPRGTSYMIDTFTPSATKAATVILIKASPAETNGRGPYAFLKTETGVGIGISGVAVNESLVEKEDVYVRSFALATASIVNATLYMRRN